MNPARLLAHFDRLIEAPDAIPRLRRFILDLAVRGELVEQDPNDEPASELLKRIKSQKARLAREGSIRREYVSAKIGEESLPFSLPARWTWARLGEVIHLVGGQHLKPGEYSDSRESGPPYITGPADFGKNGLLISRYAIARKAFARAGQILLTVKGAGVGKTAICNLPEVAISRQLMAITPIQWDAGFLTLVTDRLADSLKAAARSLIPGISREDVQDFVFAFPPLAEQRRIVAKVDELMAVCDRLEAQLTTAQTESRRLLEAVLHEALASGSDA
jgi:type I restriction enzyme S subunit